MIILLLCDLFYHIRKNKQLIDEPLKKSFEYYSIYYLFIKKNKRIDVLMTASKFFFRFGIFWLLGIVLLFFIPDIY